MSFILSFVMTGLSRQSWNADFLETFASFNVERYNDRTF